MVILGTQLFTSRELIGGCPIICVGRGFPVGFPVQSSWDRCQVSENPLEALGIGAGVRGANGFNVLNPRIFPANLGIIGSFDVLKGLVRRRINSCPSMMVSTTRTTNLRSWQHQLVGGLKHLEKYESQWEGLSHIFWKKMCGTTNQSVDFSSCV